MSIMTNIERLLKETKKTQRELTDYLGINRSVFSQWKSGNSKSYEKYIERIAAFFDVSPADLFDRDPKMKVKFVVSPPKVSETELDTIAQNVLNKIPALEPVPRDNIYQIPIYETVAAGFGAYASDSICGYMPLFIATKEEAEQTMVIRVRGDSMYPVIPDGSRVQVRRQNYADNGQIVVMLIDGEEGVLKRYYLDDGRGEVRLESYNPTYPPRIFRGADIERLRLVGVAVSVIADLP